MKLKRGYLLVGLSAIFLIFISGCVQQESLQIGQDDKQEQAINEATSKINIRKILPNISACLTIHNI